MRGRKNKDDNARVRYNLQPSDRPSDYQPVDLVRFYFTLPEPLAVPDGFAHVASTREAPGLERQDDPWVDLIFHQIESRHGRTSGGLDAVTQAIARDGSLGQEKREGTLFEPPMPAEYTVVEAVTPWHSPDEITEDLPPSAYSPRADAFTRCHRLTVDVVRALRHATEVPYGLPTYPRLPFMILYFTGRGMVKWVSVDGKRTRITLMDSPWEGGHMMLLDHFNFPDPLSLAEFDDDVRRRFWYWLGEVGRGNPLTIWRERLIEAHRANDVLGDYGHAVTLANTAAETLLDVVLALLMWEEGLQVGEAAGSFGEGKLLRRLAGELAPRLKGNWSTDGEALGPWYRDAYRVRHRVVHGGYLPRADEAQKSIDAVDGLQRFLLDRLAERRNTFTRSALLLLAEPGLRERGLWTSKIRRFAEEVAPTEPSWRDSFSNYHRSLVVALTP